VTGLLEDFDVRAQEVSTFFELLSALEATRSSAAHGPDNEGAKRLSSQSSPMLKATGFLVLYNLAEASMRDGITAIHDAMTADCVSFDQLHRELKKVVAKNAFKCRVDDLADLGELARDVVGRTFDAAEVFSGNVDARAIRTVAKKYGFDHRTTAGATGATLLTVKTARNDLGHGVKSFVEVGRDHSIEDMLKIKEEVIGYLRGVVSNIVKFIEGKAYLAQPPGPLEGPRTDSLSGQSQHSTSPGGGTIVDLSFKGG
jgi:hypothetical protein